MRGTFPCFELVWVPTAMRRVNLIPLLISAIVLASCGVRAGPSADVRAPPDPTTTHRSDRWGFTVSFPAAWHRAGRPISSLVEPREILLLATIPLRDRPTNCDAFAGSARQDLRPRDALVIILERGYDRSSEWRNFPPRPARFRPTRETAQAPEPACGDRPDTRVHWFNFTDAGRHFHVLVVAGPRAPADIRREAWRILNTLRLDPRAKPGWPASG